jgi:hypothetical protein
VIAEESCAKSCAALALELKQETGRWSANSDTLKVSEFPAARSGPLWGAGRSVEKNTRMSSFGRLNCGKLNLIPPPHATLLRGLHFQVECQRPLHLTWRDEEVLVKAAR